MKHPNRDLISSIQLTVLTVACVALAVVILAGVTMQRTTDRWHRADMRHWAEQLQQANPDVTVPAIE